MILFVGNALSKQGRAISYTEFLVDQLGKKTDEKIALVSGVKNPVLRVLHTLLFILINRKKIRLVVIDTFSTAAFYMAYSTSLLCRALGKKYITVLHGGNLPQRYAKSKGKVTELLSHAFKIVSPSFYLAEFFQSKGFKIEVIANALDLTLYQFRARTEVPERILWVRAFDRIYNPILAIKALHRLHGSNPEAQLTMIGPVKDDSFQVCKDYVAQHTLERWVKFPGLLPREQWIAQSVDYSIFINTTTIDNQPVSLLEAMALGFLVISTNVGGIPYLVNHGVNGFLVPSGDEEAIVQAIKHLISLSGEEREAISKRARAFAEEFDWNNIEPKWLTLIH